MPDELIDMPGVILHSYSTWLHTNAARKASHSGQPLLALVHYHPCTLDPAPLCRRAQRSAALLGRCLIALLRHSRFLSVVSFGLHNPQQPLGRISLAPILALSAPLSLRLSSPARCMPHLRRFLYPSDSLSGRGTLQRRRASTSSDRARTGRTSRSPNVALCGRSNRAPLVPMTRTSTHIAAYFHANHIITHLQNGRN